jgi:hypothetical protein
MSIVWAQSRVTHDQANTLDIYLQFFGCHLCQLSAGTLSYIDLSGHHGDNPVYTDMQAIADR